METETNISNFALIWGNLRNIVDFNNIVIPGTFSLIGSEKGEFPVDSYHPIYLEIPKIGEKSNLTGRYNWLSCSTDRDISWLNNRLIQLPTYNISSNVDLLELKEILHIWNNHSIPENIPCVAVAVKTKGTYTSDGRDGQLVTVLLIWPNGISRILQLDYFEGALDDCCTPEWYINSFGKLGLDKAISKFIELHRIMPDWSNIQYTILSNPSIIADNLKGLKSDYTKKGFQIEWYYDNFTIFQNDLEKIFSNIKDLFN